MIRRLETGDRELFLRLTREFYASEAVLHPIPDDFHAAAFEEMIRSDTYADGFLLLCEGEPAGYAMTAKTYSHEVGGLVIWIEEIYVSPSFRGRGLGREFFAFAENFYGDKMRRMRLETELENMAAESLYRRLGFEELGYRPFVKEFPRSEK